MVKLKTFDGAVVSPEDDSALLKKLMPDGVLEGCEFTLSEDNKIHISDGYIIYKGKNIQIVNEVIPAEIATEGTVDGCVYLKLDLNNHTKPVSIENEIAKQNFSDDEMLLATYKATATGAFDLERKCKLNVLGGYEIGDVFLSFNSVSPAERFGGVWEKLEDRMLLGASSKYPVGNMGGVDEVSLTHSQNGPHRHKETAVTDIYHDDSTQYPYFLPSAKRGYTNSSSIALCDGYEMYHTLKSGEGQPHENMPPYIAIYMWERVA